MKKGIIFDLDGTLWDSVDQVVESWNEVFRNSSETDYILTNEVMKELMGKTIEEIASISLSGVEHQSAIELMEQCCNNELIYLDKNGGILYPNLEETLSELIKKYSLYIVSNCQTGYIESFLNYHKLNKYFSDYENHGRTKLSKGENISLIIERNGLRKAIYVGDTQGDLIAAKKAGIPFVHAKYGFGTVNEPTEHINKIDELPGVVNCLHMNL